MKCIICNREFETVLAKICHYIENHMDLKTTGGLDNEEVTTMKSRLDTIPHNLCIGEIISDREYEPTCKMLVTKVIDTHVFECEFVEENGYFVRGWIDKLTSKMKLEKWMR